MRYEQAFAVLAVLQVIDVGTTLAVLQRGGVERNPMLAVLFKKIGAAPVMIALKAAFLAALWFFQEHIGIEAMLFLCAVYVVIAANNFIVLRKQGGSN